MPGLQNNLYPPIVNTFIPAFIYTQQCKVYFSISLFNKISSQQYTQNESTININTVQVSVRNQKNNKNVLDENKYPSEIMLTKLYVDNTVQSDEKYYIKIRTSDIAGSGFNLNEYYKIQIRFTNMNAAAPPVQQSSGIDSWISNNIQYFSQWSQVTLIYGISQPNLILTNKLVNNTIIIEDGYDAHIAGKIQFSNPLDTEKLNKYKITLYDSVNNNLISDSGWIYNEESVVANEIYYNLIYNLQINHIYKLNIEIITENLYVWSQPKSYNLKVTEEEKEQLKLDISIQANDYQGCIELVIIDNFRTQQESQQVIQDDNQIKYFYEPNPLNRVTGNTLYLSLSGPQGIFKSSYVNSNDDILVLYNKGNPKQDLSYGTNFIIKRASYKDNFKIWYEIDSFEIKENNITKLVWEDYTAEPGIWYKYYVIRKDMTGGYISAKVIETPMMIMTDDIFLSSQGKQLKIKFDPRIDNFSIKTSQSIIETLGSRYPFVRKNGNIFYKTFSLSGTISFLTDLEKNNFYSSEEDLYGQYADLYRDYNEEHHINFYNDFVREKEFRNKVIDFLYADDVKLFRSLTEGNILIKLSNVTFTPNTTLGRMIYSFSCTAYEIDENNFNNYKKYNVIKSQSYRGEVNEV